VELYNLSVLYMLTNYYVTPFPYLTGGFENCPDQVTVWFPVVILWGFECHCGLLVFCFGPDGY